MKGHEIWYISNCKNNEKKWILFFMKYGPIIVSGSSNFTILLWAKALQFFGGKPHVSLEMCNKNLNKRGLYWPFQNMIQVSNSCRLTWLWVSSKSNRTFYNLAFFSWKLIYHRYVFWFSYFLSPVSLEMNLQWHKIIFLNEFEMYWILLFTLFI